MKGQWKGVWLTKVAAPVTIKVELGTANPPLPTTKKYYKIFVMVYKLLSSTVDGFIVLVTKAMLNV